MNRIRLVALVIVVFATTSCSYLKALFFAPSSKMPASLEAPSVKLGAGDVERSVFADVPGVGALSQILAGAEAQRVGAAIAAVGTDGAAFLKVDGDVKEAITFSRRMYRPVNLVFLGDGEYGFLNRDQSWSSDVMLFDRKGSLRWSYKGPSGVDDSAAGDTDGDGKAEIVVGMNGGGGIHLLDMEGKKLWEEEDGNVWHVEIADTDGDGRGEILHSNAGGYLTTRDAEGRTRRQAQLASYVAKFALVRARDRRQMILISDEGALYLARLDGSRSQRLNVTGLAPHGNPAGTFVRFAGKRELFASLIGYERWKRSVLVLHDTEGRTVYQEVIGESCGAITAIPTGADEALLVGCGQRLLLYGPKKR